jgi:hypothetical protein
MCDVLCVLAAVAAMTDLQQNYFVPLLTSGGDSHLAFRTGRVDPKLQAINVVRRKTGESQKAIIVSRGWWTRQPLAYLSASDSRVTVCGELEARLHRKAIASNQVWFAELAGSDAANRLRQRLNALQIAVETTICTDYAGRAVVLLFRPIDCSAESLKIFSSPQFDKFRS